MPIKMQLVHVSVYSTSPSLVNQWNTLTFMKRGFVWQCALVCSKAASSRDAALPCKKTLFRDLGQEASKKELAGIDTGSLVRYNI